MTDNQSQTPSLHRLVEQIEEQVKVTGDPRRDSFKQGQTDYHELVPYTRCPYTEDDDRSDWQRGWELECLEDNFVPL